MAVTYSDRELEAMLADSDLDPHLHFDALPVHNATVSDLRVAHFVYEYLPAALDPEELAANDRATEERLAAAKMIVAVELRADPRGRARAAGIARRRAVISRRRHRWADCAGRKSA